MELSSERADKFDELVDEKVKNVAEIGKFIIPYLQDEILYGIKYTLELIKEYGVNDFDKDDLIRNIAQSCSIKESIDNMLNKFKKENNGYYNLWPDDGVTFFDYETPDEDDLYCRIKESLLTGAPFIYTGSNDVLYQQMREYAKHSSEFKDYYEEFLKDFYLCKYKSYDFREAIEMFYLDSLFEMVAEQLSKRGVIAWNPQNDDLESYQEKLQDYPFSRYLFALEYRHLTKLEDKKSLLRMAKFYRYNEFNLYYIVDDDIFSR